MTEPMSYIACGHCGQKPQSNPKCALCVVSARLKVAVEALRWYADEEHYDEGSSFLRGLSKVQGDKGWRADDALKKIERKEGKS